MMGFSSILDINHILRFILLIHSLLTLLYQFWRRNIDENEESLLFSQPMVFGTPFKLRGDANRDEPWDVLNLKAYWFELFMLLLIYRCIFQAVFKANKKFGLKI